MPRYYALIGKDESGNEVRRDIYKEPAAEPLNHAVQDLLDLSQVAYVEVRADYDDVDFAIDLRWSDGTHYPVQYADFVRDNASMDEFVALEPEMLAKLQEGPGASYRLPICAGLFVDVVRL